MSSRQVNEDVLVVGAGPTGLTLALSLLRQGVTVRVVEKITCPAPGQRGAGIVPRTLEVFEALGLSAEVQKASIAIPKLRIYKLPGGLDVVKEIDTHVEPTPDRPFPRGRFLGQNHLEPILSAAVLENGGTIDYGVEFKTLEQSDDFVKVTLARLNDGGRIEEIIYKYVIGADGGKSIVRKTLGLPLLGETHEDQQVAFGDFYTTGLDPDYMHSWGEFLTKGAFVRPTETPGLFCMVVSGDMQKHISAVDQLASVRDMFKEAIGGRDDIQIADVTWQGIYRFNIRMAPEFSKGKVFLAGDAAHVHSPTGGQGLNTGIQDAFNLGWKLALVLKGHASPTLLESYSTERVAVVSEMLSITTQLFNKTVNAGKNPNDKSAMHRRDGILNQFGVNYRMSDLVLDDGGTIEGVGPYGGAEGGDVRAGDRAPDASGLVHDGSEPKRLFEIFDSNAHTVLVFADRLPDGALQTSGRGLSPRYPTDSVRIVVVQKGTVAANSISGDGNIAIYEDREGHADASYRSGDDSGKVFVIRPDGHVGARLKSLEELESYFRKIFSI